MMIHVPVVSSGPTTHFLSFYMYCANFILQLSWAEAGLPIIMLATTRSVQ
jgi:hypothetical protein